MHGKCLILEDVEVIYWLRSVNFNDESLNISDSFDCQYLYVEHGNVQMPGI